MKKVKLDDICDFYPGNSWKAKDFSNAGIPIIRINNLYQDKTDFVYWNDKYEDRYKVKKDDILLSLSGTIKVHKWEGTEGLLNQRIVKIQSKEGINKDWVFYKIQNSIDEIISKAKEAVIKNVSINDIKAIELLLPDIETQNKTVAILDKVKGLLNNKNETIRIHNEFIESVFLEMFGKKNPSFNSWKEISIGELGKHPKKSFRTGPFGSKLKHERFKEEGDVAVLGIDNAVDNIFKWKKRRFISKDEFIEFKNYQVYPRDVIITIMGTVGRSAVIPENIDTTINTKHLAAITLNEKRCNPYYLAFSIHSNPYVTGQLRIRERGAVMDGLNLTLIKELKIKEAPIELQNRFELVYKQNIKTVNKIFKSKDEFQNLFDVLSYLLFKGELNFNTAVDLEMLLENDYTFFKKNSNQAAIRLLLKRLNKDELNDNKFYDQQLYDKAKDFVFELLKENKIKQVFDDKSKNVILRA